MHGKPFRVGASGPETAQFLRGGTAYDGQDKSQRVPASISLNGRYAKNYTQDFRKRNLFANRSPKNPAESIAGSVWECPNALDSLGRVRPPSAVAPRITCPLFAVVLRRTGQTQTNSAARVQDECRYKTRVGSTESLPAGFGLRLCCATKYPV